MPFTVYILHSAALDQYYVGHTMSVPDRINRHTHHGSKATKNATDWKVVYEEHFDSRSEAMRREMAIKKQKSRKYIETLISPAG